MPSRAVGAPRSAVPALPTRLDPNDAKAVVGILVGDALNQPGQDFSIGSLRLRLHDVQRWHRRLNL